MTDIAIPDLAVASSDYAISAGECIFRCHRLNFGGTDFNPGIGLDSRFTPLISPMSGQPVPTLYAAKSFDAAVYEAIFRQEQSTDSSVIANKVNTTCVSSITVCRELLMVSLFTPELIPRAISH